MTPSFIDKLAFIEIQNRKVLVTKSRGKDTWYIPGGKREQGETDEQALIREVKEELSVDISPQTIQSYGIFTAQAHGKPEGIMVRMSCFTASYSGLLSPNSEIEAIDFFTHNQKKLCSLVDHQIFDDLQEKNLID